MTFLFVKDVGVALLSSMCPDQLQAFREVHNNQGFIVGRKNTLLFFCPEEPLPGAPMHVCQALDANRRRTNLIGPLLWAVLIEQRFSKFSSFFP